jgi:hypothetical protein
MVPEFEPVEITSFNTQANVIDHNDKEDEDDDDDDDDEDDEFNDVEEITDDVLDSSMNSGSVDTNYGRSLLSSPV